MLTEEASVKQDPEILAANYKTGWNANICDEFIKLHEAAKKAPISFEFSWSRELASTLGIGQRARFTVSDREIELAQEAANRLRARQEDQPESIIGLIIELKAEHMGGLLISCNCSPRLIGRIPYSGSIGAG